MSQVELNDGEASSVLILGIDPGTTGAKMAFLKAYEVHEEDMLDLIQESKDRIHMLWGFPGYRQTHVSTLPTCLIYHKEGGLAKWGHEAVNFQGRDAFDPEYLVTNWKLKLLEASRQGILEATPQRLRKPPGTFATDFFGAITNYLFNKPRSCLLNHFGSDDLKQFKFIDVVIAMPPGWAHEEHLVFSDAVKRALANTPNIRVITVSETECALRSWMAEEGKDLEMKDGEVVTLLDLGGGTACLSAFCYDAGNGRWIHLESHSINAGSELVTASFERHFLERLKGTELPEMTQVLYKARQAFDLRKMQVGEDDEDESWSCPVNGLKKDSTKDFRDGHMKFTSKQLESYFDPLHNKIIETFDDMTTRISQTYRKPKYCVLAGAYSRNVLFFNRFHAHNDDHMQMKIFLPVNPAELVARGACLTRVQGDCRLASGSRISVGIMTFIKWKDVKKKCPDAHHFVLGGDRYTLWCRVITWVIKKGDKADPEKAIIDHDGILSRRRHIESQDSFVFNETIFTSEAHPGEVGYTVLMYSTDDSGRNKQDFKEKHGMPLHIHEFTLDLTNKQLIEKDGSKAVMKNAPFKRDRVGKYFEYKYYMNLSQTDCRMSLEAYSANGRTRRMLLQHSISAFEVESTELQDEHRFAEQLSQRAIADEAFGEIFEAGPIIVGTRSLQVRDSERLSPPLQRRSSQRNQKNSRSLHGFPLGPVTEENEDSMRTTNGALGSQYDLRNVATAVMQEVDQGGDKSSSEDQEALSRKRSRGADVTDGDFGSPSLVTPSSGQWTPRGASPDFASPTQSQILLNMRPAEIDHIPSLKDPVTQVGKKKSSLGIRKGKHRLARPSILKRRLALLRETGAEF